MTWGGGGVKFFSRVEPACKSKLVELLQTQVVVGGWMCVCLFMGVGGWGGGGNEITRSVDKRVELEGRETGHLVVPAAP